MVRRELAAWLLLVALLPVKSAALRERERSGFRLRSRKARLDEAFRKLRLSFEKSHPGWSKEGKLSTETKSVTSAPPIGVEETFVQLSNRGEHRRHLTVAPPPSNGTEGVLFSVWTDSLFYDTRLAGILETWGKEIPLDRFMAVSDKKRSSPSCTSNVPGCHVEETQCPPHSHWEGACCKWAEGVIKAQERMEHNPSLKWAFFSDDDVYLRPEAIATTLRKHDREVDPKKAQALGIFGCSTASGCSGLCGGGGFAINRAAVQRLASKDPATFLQEEMSYCSKCERWADQAISMIWKDKGIEMKQQPGLNGWIMPEETFKQQLTNGNSLLLFHYEKTKHQMEALHEMFTGEKLLKRHDGPCVEYKGHKTCAASWRQDDIPFTI